MKKTLCLILILFLVMGVIFVSGVFADTPLLTTDKTAYGIDEPVTVTAQGDGTDWVGIYYPGAPNSIRWVYVTDVGAGVAFDLRSVGTVNNGAPEVLGAGRYIIRLMPDDTTDLSRALCEIEITIGEVSDSPVEGDASRLSLPKTDFAVGEAIPVTAVGAGKDWVGIYELAAPHSIRWAYVTDNGSGNEFDLWTESRDNGSSPDILPAGEYIIRLMPDDTTDLSRAIAWVTVTVGGGSAEDKPATPTATYTLADLTDGFATGVLSVSVPAGDSAKHIIPYWGDGNQRLTGYTPLPKFKVTGEASTYEYPEGLMIPAEATQLLVYTANAAGELCETPCIIDLPANAAHKPLGEPLFEFQAVSDIHIYTDKNHPYNKNFKRMLEDVAANSKNSLGVFIVGDMADHGERVEIDEMLSIYGSVSGVPRLFYAIGNHDFYNGSYEEKLAQFLSYAKLPDGSSPESCHYDFWLKGYHFVFLGNDAYPVDGVRTTLSTETLKWLDKALAADRDASRPTFLFLHQSLYNTVSGSLPGEGWNGVENDMALRAVLRKYPEVILFNGHSHWTLDSKGVMYRDEGNLPTMFNTASVAYLWSGYNRVEGENLDGSQGYYVRVYEDCVTVLGRDFTTGEWVPAAQFYLPYEKATPEAPDSTSDTTVGAKPEEAPDSTAEAPTDTPDLPTDAKPDGKKGGGLVAAIVGGVLLTAGAVALVILKKKKHRYDNE